MCCTPGRCPCWPREASFDVAEMDLLRVLQDAMVVRPAHYDNPVTRGGFFVALQGASTRVQRSRLAYVLSTFVQVEYACSQTALNYTATDGGIVKWLLHVGVCPNMGVYNGGRALYRGWDGGPRHPGRPLQFTKTVFQYYSAWFSDKSSSIFVAHGAYPCGAADVRRIAEGRWHRWHARASRRLWVKTVLQCL
jgi:hypothetical protein